METPVSVQAERPKKARKKKKEEKQVVRITGEKQLTRQALCDCGTYCGRQDIDL